jgi:hypothetical protein
VPVATTVSTESADATRGANVKTAAPESSTTRAREMTERLFIAGNPQKDPLPAPLAGYGPKQELELSKGKCDGDLKRRQSAGLENSAVFIGGRVLRATHSSRFCDCLFALQKDRLVFTVNLRRLFTRQFSLPYRHSCHSACRTGKASLLVVQVLRRRSQGRPNAENFR